jgi:broad specificity phosphatase PhoE
MARHEIHRLIIELVPHMDAGDRGSWSGDQDERPLSQLGRDQAEALAHELGETDITAIHASPALRAFQTVQPLAIYRGLEVQTLADLAEKQLGEDTRRLAERGVGALDFIRGQLRGGRAVACSHGDLIPATVTLLARTAGLPAPEPLESRAQRYSIVYEGGTPRIERVSSGVMGL